MQLKISFYLFLFYYFVDSCQSLDLNENSDEVEIFKHLFAKLNKIIDGNDLLLKELSKMKQRIQNLEGKLNYTSATFKSSEEFTSCKRLPSRLSVEPSDSYCFGDNWSVIQRRTDGSENFFREWNDYKQGFGNKSNEFFAGLENIHRITTATPHELLILMEDFDNSKRFAKYDRFIVGSEEEGYALKSLGLYSGNAGDSLIHHIGSKFSTKNRDNDQHLSLNCAEIFQSAWWYKACFESNLNGCYSDANLRDSKTSVGCGIHWRTFRGQWYSLKFVEMMIRPTV